MIPILATLVAPLLLFALLRWPELGTLMTAALMYLNALPILIRYHNVSPLLAFASIGLLFPPLIKSWLVDRDRFAIDYPFLLMLLFLASTLVSSLFSRDIAISLPWVARYVTQGLLTYLLIINFIRTTHALRRLVWTLVLCGAFLASLTVYQEVTGSYANDFGGFATRRMVHGERLVQGMSAPTVTKSLRRAHGPDLDANRYAQLLIVLLPLGWWLTKHGTALAARAVAGTCTSLILGGVVLTYSRGAFVGLLAMLGLMLAFRILTPRQLLFAGACLVLSMMLLSPGYVDRMATLRGVEGLAPESDVEVEAVARTRATIMIVAWRVFLDHPILGVGPDQFAVHYVVKYGAELFFIDAIGRHFAAHSLYLQLAAETGLAGLGIFMWIVTASLARLAMAHRRTAGIDRCSADLAAAVFVAISTYMVTGFFLHLAYPRYFWLLLALGGPTVWLCRSQIPAAEPLVPARHVLQV